MCIFHHNLLCNKILFLLQVSFLSHQQTDNLKRKVYDFHILLCKKYKNVTVDKDGTIIIKAEDKTAEDIPYTGTSDNIMIALVLVLICAWFSYYKYQNTILFYDLYTFQEN